MTTFLIYLSVYGDNFPLEELTELTQLQPSRTYEKGTVNQQNPNRPKYIETAWNYTVGDFETLFFDEVSPSFCKVFDNIAEKIHLFSKKYSLGVQVNVVVNIASETMPSFFINKNFVSCLASLGAELDFDCYMSL